MQPGGRGAAGRARLFDQSGSDRRREARRVSGMARLPYAAPATASEPVRDALGRVPPLNIFRMMANAETAFRPWLRWGATLLGELELDPLLRELAILRVARITPHAEYEWVQHVPIAKAVGAGDEQVVALERDQ